MNIGTINNYYGGLEVKVENGKYYWGIDNYEPTVYQEIPKYLYDALVKFEKEGLNENIFNIEMTYGDLMTIDEFEEAFEEGWIDEDDGIGYFSDGKMRSNKDAFGNRPEGATHVVWFNK